MQAPPVASLIHSNCAQLKLGESQDCHLKSHSACSPSPPASFPQLEALCVSSHGYLFTTSSWNSTVGGGRLPSEPGLSGAEAPDPPLVHDMGSQSGTFSLSWILYLSQAWHAGVLVGGETRGDARLTGYFLPSAGLPAAASCVLVPRGGGRTCSAQSDKDDHSLSHLLSLRLLCPVPPVYA